MGNQSKPDPNSRLGKYIRSRGRVIPMDAHAFRSPMDNYALCLFCLKEHDYIEVRIRNLKDPSDFASVTALRDIHCCEDCNKEILKMEGRIMRASEDEGLFREMYAASRSQAVRRLRKYLEEGLLEENHQSYVTHLDPRLEKDEVAQYNKLCYGCQRFVPGNSYIMAPQGAELYTLDGGRLKLCNDCAAELETIVIDNQEEKPPMIAVDHCPTCRQKYYVTESEYEFRTMQDPPTHGHHMCPKCAYNNIISASHSPASFYQLVRDTDTDEILRYRSITCGFCQDKIDIDQTLDPLYLLQKYMTKGNTPICPGCYQFGTIPNICFRSADNETGGMVWMFFQGQEKLTAYRRRSEEIQVLETRYAQLSMDSMFDEITAIVSDLTGTQLKIPYDGLIL